MTAACLLFAAMAVLVSAAHRVDPEMSVLVASLVRSVVNLVALVLLAKGSVARLWGDGRPALWSRGVFGGLSLLCYFLGLMRLSAGEAAFLNQTSAVWVAALAPLLIGEPTPRRIWFAIAGSMVGLGFLGFPRGTEGDLLGRVAAAASGLFASFAYVSIRRASETNTPLTIVFYFTVVGTAVSALLALGLDVPWPRDPRVYALLAGSGVCATVAQLWMTEAYRMGPASVVAAAGAAGPVFNGLLGWWFLDQAPDGPAAIGMAILLVTGILLPLAGARRPAPALTADAPPGA
jgi:S-adenosylmethionine uptake transporter